MTTCIMPNCNHKKDVMQCPKCGIYLCDHCSEAEDLSVETIFGCEAKCPICGYFAKIKGDPMWIDTYDRW